MIDSAYALSDVKKPTTDAAGASSSKTEEEKVVEYVSCISHLDSRV